MALIFFGKDDNSKAGGSPAVFVDDETNELVFQGITETDPETLAIIDRHSRTMPNESSVRVPPHLVAKIMEAIDVIRARSA
ncbi:hypothetical protein GCM10022254_05980 [Actinomadura meridiana]|uniref:DUF5753 domain-containing protein n=1 Tax=Actinomadura meridiana TaxID=559626 RepID=A0ABP8BT19_9ACTN